ncbi:asparagine synthase-related protein [Caulobacter radicis]|uniref:asparagine synthase-related protein n=1 Tax=Caulobacter radicis TaxID=2172650 RepID=UPI001FCB3AE7|nr:asparagine synthase-related protein [Caulobacter radicis]
MGDYLVMTWPPGMPSLAAEAMRGQIEADRASGWRLAHAAFCVAVYVRGAHPPMVRILADRGGVIIGDVFDLSATRQGKVADFALEGLRGLEPDEAARRLCGRAWGRYVAVLRDRDASPTVLRDPTGALECLTWTREAVTIVASDVPATGAVAPQGLAIDWAAVRGLIARHGVGSQICPLAGVEVVGPGELRDGRGGRRERLWSPAWFARRTRRADPAELAVTIDAVVAALTRDRRAILAEISGGLDSAIVATSLARCGAPVAGAINYYWPQPEGDERIWARQIAEVCGFSLTEVPRDMLRLDAEVLMRHAHGPRPGFNAQDPDLDADLAGRAQALGADALFSGQGGDGVFYQMVPAALASDIMLGHAVDGGRIAALATLARRARVTIFGLCAAALSRRGRVMPDVPPPPYLGGQGPRPGPHAWIRDAGHISPAKRIQVRGLANAQAAFGDSLRGRAASLCYPLMSQPVMELCFSISAPLLAIGPVDRPFARAAFADRLPPASLARRSKGAVTKYFACSLTASLPALRDFLLEGRLVARGLVVRERLEDLMDPEAMIWRDSVGEIFLAGYLEAWVRVWEAKLAGRAAPDPRLVFGASLEGRSVGATGA